MKPRKRAPRSVAIRIVAESPALDVEGIARALRIEGLELAPHSTPLEGKTAGHWTCDTIGRMSKSPVGERIVTCVGPGAWVVKK